VGERPAVDLPGTLEMDVDGKDEQDGEKGKGVTVGWRHTAARSNHDELRANWQKLFSLTAHRSKGYSDPMTTQ
jgi:hypothetical protein